MCVGGGGGGGRTMVLAVNLQNSVITSGAVLLCGGIYVFAVEES